MSVEINEKAIKIPEFCLVILVGVSGTGKTTFANKHFSSENIISLDETTDISDSLNLIEKRLKDIRLTIVDGSNLEREFRKTLLELAKKYYCQTIVFVLNLPEKVCQKRNSLKSSEIIHNQCEQLRESFKYLQKDGFKPVYNLNSIDEIDDINIKMEPLRCDLKNEKGAFDIIGDIHGCFDELVLLINKLGYIIKENDDDNYYTISHPENRRIIFLGDLVDRGPNSPGVLKLVMSVVQSGKGLCVLGNHDNKLKRKLQGNDVKLDLGLIESLNQLENESPEFLNRVIDFLDNLDSHYVLENGNLIVSHAGVKEKYQGRSNKKVLNFGLYGETNGETDGLGYPVRLEWALNYNGNAAVVYGHTPNTNPEWINNTMCIDTGCVFGGQLTALRYPEKELVSVPAVKVYWKK